MHELALVEAVIQAVEEKLPAELGAQRGVRVVRVRLRVGPLAAVVPDAMRFCFDVCTRGTRLDGAALEIELAEVEARCRSCDARFLLASALPLCACGSADLAIERGDELLIRDVEVA
jgi:hydrogenase nickel incorporation protein HypA/HybF